VILRGITSVIEWILDAVRVLMLLVLCLAVGAWPGLRTLRRRRVELDKQCTLLPTSSDQATFLYEKQESIAQTTTEKVKQLLTLALALGSILLAYVGALSSRTWGLVAGTALYVAVYLCIEALGVETWAVPMPSAADWLTGMDTATWENREVQTYQVTMYEVARRWFFVGLIILPAIAMQPRKKDDLLVALQEIVGAARSGVSMRLVGVHGDTIVVRVAGGRHGHVHSAGHKRLK
jgi:hypothetical protein